MWVERDQGGIASAISQMADGLGRLIVEHLTLARLELVDDAKQVGKGLLGAAVFAPMIVVGWAFLCCALSFALLPALGGVGALATVGGANVVGGGFGIWRALAKLRGQRVMDETLKEVERSAAVLVHTTQETVSSHGA